MFLPLGPFRPDQPDTVPGRLADLLNASLKPDGETVAYGPLKGFLLIGVLSSDIGVTSGIKGSLTCVTAAGAYINIVMTTGSIFQLGVDGTLTEIGNGYHLPSGDRWGACQFGSKAIFTNTFDGMLEYDIELGGAITAISGAPAARIVRVVFDVVFALDCDGENRLMRNSDFDYSNWSTGVSGYQPMPDGEELVGIAEVADGTALVFQRNAIRTLYRIPDSSLYQMRRLISNKGASNPWGIVPANGGVYFVNANGFQFATAEGVAPIGQGKIDNWWFDDLATDGLARVDGFYDPAREVIRWRYKTSADAGDDTYGNWIFAKAIDYDIATGEFVPTEVGSPYDGAAAMIPTGSSGYTMEELDSFGDMDDLNGNLSLDDRFYLGGSPVLLGIVWVGSASLFFGYLNAGNNLAATFETTTLSDNQESRITSLRPVTDAATVEIQVGRSERLQNTMTWNTAAGLQPSGRVAINPETRGKNHRIRATVDANDSSFTSIRGFEDVKYTAPGGVK